MNAGRFSDHELPRKSTDIAKTDFRLCLLCFIVADLPSPILPYSIPSSLRVNQHLSVVVVEITEDNEGNEDRSLKSLPTHRPSILLSPNLPSPIFVPFVFFCRKTAWMPEKNVFEPLFF